MSFWPFGQNINNSNINKILDEYFSVLHAVESASLENREFILQQESSHSNSNSSGGGTDDLIHGVGSVSSNHTLHSTNSSGAINISDSNNNSNSLNTTSSTASGSAQSNGSSGSGKKNLHESLQALNSSFIDQILDESELLNELTRKNNTLLDFICFGYFYDSNYNKILNLEYLINLLMFCINKINELSISNNTDSTSVINDSVTTNIASSISSDSTSATISSNTNDSGEQIMKNNLKKTLQRKLQKEKEEREAAHDSDGDDEEEEYGFDIRPTKSIQSRNNSTYNSTDTINEECYLQKATIISEVFALDIWLISESLVKTPVYLNNIWSILSNPSFNKAKSPLVAIFLKINTNLLLTRQDQYLNFIRSLKHKKADAAGITITPTSHDSNDNDINENDNDDNENKKKVHETKKTNINSNEISDGSDNTNGLVDDMLQHINCPVLMDFFLKIISTDKMDTPTGILELVHEQQLIKKLLNFFQNDVYSTDLQSSSSDFLKALIAISANAPLDDLTIGPNILTRQLCTDDEILNLFVHIITKERKYALNHAISIVIELIRKNNSDYDQVNLLQTTIKSHPPNSRDPIYLGYMLKKFSLHLKEIVAVLYESWSSNDILVNNETTTGLLRNQMGELYEPLGFEKFKIVELIAELLHCSNMGLMNSRKAEFIAKKRDSLRLNISAQLEDALQDLNITSSINTLDLSNNSSSGNLTTAHDTISSPTPSFTVSPENYNTETGLSPLAGDNNEDIIVPQSQDDISTPSPPLMTPQSPTEKKLEIPSTSDENNISNNNPVEVKNQTTQYNESSINSEFYDKEEELIYQLEEIDEFFDIPYVNENQNLKLRTNPTIGDFFKVTLFDLQILPHIVTIFLKYPWNNFWHNVIFDILQQIFNGRMDYSYNSFLVYTLFANKNIGQFSSVKVQMKGNTENLFAGDKEKLDFDLPRDLILKGYEASCDYYHENKINLGFMGHLVLIAEEIVKFSKVYKVDLISQDIHDSLANPKWIYYADDILMDTRLMYSKILGGDMIATNGNSEEDLLFEQRLQQQQEQGLANKGNSTNAQESPDSNGQTGGSQGSFVDEEFIHYTTQSDLHKKLKEKLIQKSDNEVRQKNDENGVIVLGYSADESS